ncbi:hypothetical protein AB5I41_04420 [Sphingomonas sp. MMS24-JH45]
MVSAEIALAKAKVGDATQRYKAAATFFAVAGVLALAGLIALLVGLIISLATVSRAGPCDPHRRRVGVRPGCRAGDGRAVAAAAEDRRMSELDQAEARAALAREKLNTTVGALQAQLEPQVLMGRAHKPPSTAANARPRASVDVAKRNPAALAGGVALVAAFFGRRSIVGGVRRLFGKKPETPAHVRGGNAERNET